MSLRNVVTPRQFNQNRVKKDLVAAKGKEGIFTHPNWAGKNQHLSKAKVSLPKLNLPDPSKYGDEP